MSVPVYRIDIDLRENDIQKFVQLRGGDEGSKIIISLREGGDPFRLDRNVSAVAVSWLDEDGEYCESECRLTPDGCAEMTVGTLTQSNGIIPCKLKWSDGETFNSTAQFFAVVSSG